MLYAKDNACSVGVRFHGEYYALVVLFAQPARLEQWYGRAAVLATDGARPQVSHGGLAIYDGIVALEVCLCTLQHPPAPGAHVPCQVCFYRDHIGLHTRQLRL